MDKILEAQEIKEINNKWYTPIITFLLIISLFTSLFIFIDAHEKREIIKEEKATTELNNRFEYVPRTPSGVCPSGTTVFDEFNCLKLKNN
jgi:hypothetical protein